ncbi:hypothetical protein ACPCHT_06085 [Nucisporomicrobium flavum]|uniref:hypothetical protein n=1 Tax=Nucisporomicrobium flavum TaxID=2785915 RepID=UPI003C2B1611
MTRKRDVPYESSKDLPPYRGIVAFDARGFTELPGRLHQPVSGLIPQLVEEAFTAVGLAEVWQDPPFFGPTGDGFALGVPTRVLPYLVHPFVDEVQRVLTRHNRKRRAGEALVQLRVSIHVGPVEDGPNRYVGGNGVARNDTHRLLDSVPVKAVLAAASADVTFVAAILSDRLYNDVVLQGYAGLHPDRLIEVPASVAGKTFAQRAWLYVPEPSGNLALAGAPQPPEKPAGTPGAGAGRGSSSTVINAPGNRGGVAGTVHGGMTWETGEERS